MTLPTLTIDAISVMVRRSPRTRRFTLKMDPLLGPLLVLPTKAALKDAQKFLAQNKLWLEQRLAQAPQTVPFAHGSTIPLLGMDHLICHAPQARRGVWVEDQKLMVSGSPDHLSRRVHDFLKAYSLRVIRPIAFDLSAKIHQTPTRITVRSLKSRWGSCSSAHDLSFSWRLILAPSEVLTYVVAHEVAHLAHMNHSPAFWSVVAELMPNYQTPQRWLKTQGAGLFKYGGM